jgi:glyoxylase-like metal-dependent hydrolase (beta-lactamase superfamily II)
MDYHVLYPVSGGIIVSIRTQTIVVGPIENNSYVVSNDESGEAFVIDPGIEYDPILQALQGYKLTDILLTHAHFDHIGGASRLVADTGARIWVHTREAAWLSSPIHNLSAVTGLTGPITAPAAGVLLSGGERLELLGQEIVVSHTPGHTPGHVVYQYNGAVFVGDLIFRGSVGRTDFPEGDTQALITSIKQTIFALPGDTSLFPGHGPATTVEFERKYNPYLCGI